MAYKLSAGDYENSYLLGELDGESWAGNVHAQEAQALSLLSAEDVGQQDFFGKELGGFLREQAHDYQHHDPHFHPIAYYEGFLAAVRKTRRQLEFAYVGKRSRWYW
jgi:hypothetical protein